MTPREKAQAVVVAGMPAGPGFGGVLVRRWNTELPRPRGLIFADQEGGLVKTFASLPPSRPASSYRSAAEARAAGAATAAALRREGVHASFAPVLDLPDGPLGSRQFARPEYGVAFARGLGRAACVKHFPGLGSTPLSTDEARVYGVVRTQDLAPFRAAIQAGVPCVMVGHAIYPQLGPRRASFEPKTYALLRRLGFRGVAITDSIGVLGSPYAPFWARLALRAGADLVLTTSARDAGRIVDALVPLAGAGELDAKLVRVLRYRNLVAPAP
jgi:beta-N-acetylhexosaminidase